MMIGETKLGYKITELVGQGGFGTVYKAVKKNKAMETVRALKHISLPSRKQWTDIYNSMGNDVQRTDEYFDTILQEILNEIRILADLTSKGVKNVVWYYENEIEDTPSPKHYDIYLLMEYLTALPSFIETHEMKVKDVIKVGTDILSALIECHKRKIIHRDIKTDNIFISDEGDYKLGDFGVSKKLSDRSRATSMKGTPNYIAPEVYLGEAYDETVDLYSLGIVLYRLLNFNRNPFMPEYPASYNSEDEDKAFELRMKGETPAYPMNASSELGDIILKAISNKENRFKSASEFKQQLDKVAKSMSKGELDKVVLKNELASVDFSTFGSKNELTQMANNNSNSQSNSFSNSQQNNHSMNSMNSMNFSGNVTGANDGNKKNKLILPIAAVAVIAVIAGLVFVMNGGKSASGDKKLTNNWYVAPNGKEYYLDSNGEPYRNTAKNINGVDYFFDNDGEKVVNDWFQYDGNYYFIDSNGNMLKNEFKKMSSNEWYYLGSDGKMLKSTFYTIDGSTYYFESDGVMKIDTLFQVGMSLYFAQNDGSIKKDGWCLNNQYYADSEGKILMNTVTPDGVKVDSTGRRVQVSNNNNNSSNNNSSTKETTAKVSATTAPAQQNNTPTITNGKVLWGEHLRHTETIILDDYGENGSGKISIDVTKLKEDGTDEVESINDSLEKIFEEICERAQFELPYKYFTMDKTSLSTSNDSQVILVVTGEMKYLDNEVVKMRYKLVLERANGSVVYEKVR